MRTTYYRFIAQFLEQIELLSIIGVFSMVDNYHRRGYEYYENIYYLFTQSTYLNAIKYLKPT